MKRTLYPLFAIFLFSISSAQTADITKEPGYVDFGDLSKFETSTGVTEVILDEELLSTLAQISTDEDPNIMSLLGGLKLVKANVFKVTAENKEQLKNKITNLDSKLTRDNWKRIVKTISEEEIANVYIKTNVGKQIVGLTVTAFEAEDEAAFVNIVGTIDLVTIGKLGKKFDIPQLEGVGKDNGDKDEK